MRVVVFEGLDGWRYRTVAENGEKLTVSEAYASRSNAERAARAFIDAVRYAATLDLPSHVEFESK